MVKDWSVSSLIASAIMLYAIFGGCNVYIGSLMNRDSNVVTANYFKQGNIGEEKSVAETTKQIS